MGSYRQGYLVRWKVTGCVSVQRPWDPLGQSWAGQISSSSLRFWTGWPRGASLDVTSPQHFHQLSRYISEWPGSDSQDGYPGWTAGPMDRVPRCTSMFPANDPMFCDVLTLQWATAEGWNDLRSGRRNPCPPSATHLHLLLGPTKNPKGNPLNLLNYTSSHQAVYS